MVVDKTQNIPVRILLIEDNPGDSRLTQEILKNADNFNFKLTVAENLVDGLYYIEQSEIDIVLLDLSLPDSSGFQTIIRTREKTINIPIIVLTGLKDETFSRKIIQAGAQDYFIKDQIESNPLVRSIYNAIERNKMILTIESLMETLQKNESQLKKIIEKNADSIIIVDKKNIVRFVNPIAEKFFKRNKEDFVGKQFGYPTGPETKEITIIRQPDKIAIAEINSVEIEWEGEIVDLLTVRDVTDHKMYELRLQESEKRYHDLFENSPYPFLILSKQGVVIDCNSSLEQLLSFSKEEIVNKNYKDTPLVNSNNLELFNRLYSEILKGNFPNPMEVRYVKENKPAIWVKLNFSSINIGNQALIYVLLDNITAIKQSEREVRRLEQTLHDMNALIEDAPLAIFLIHNTGKILRANQKALKLFHYQLGEILNLMIFDLISSDFSDNIAKHYNEDIYNSLDPVKLEITHKRKDGRIIDLEITSTIIAIADNLIIQSYFSDITERKNSERDRQKLLDQLISSLEFKSKFLATMSHELRTPLNAIIGFTSLLLDKSYGPLNKDQIDFLMDVSSEANHLKSLIDTILDLSFIDMGKFKLDIETFKLLPILNEISSIVNHLFVKKGIKMNIIDIEENTYIQADPLRFKQIFYNLLDNAIKFTENGQITLRCEEKDSLWEFKIQDTGIGIAEKDYDIVFKEFGRVETDKSKPISGSGIGLALTKRLVELHGGEIWFESEVGKGTTFFFSIPKEYKIDLKIDA
ncbi:MAG: PAS domain S-box protein [Candidatus Lokiarchaeota archaeon]|nr:PAS domain S-box protein [Candidatus Lokiarchaeota archaeon]